MSDLTVEPLGGPLDATVTLPGSKSLTNRALVCAALAEGTSVLERPLLAGDTEAMLDAVGRLGAGLRHEGEVLEVDGTAGRLAYGPVDIDVRHSGTTARFVAPVVALGRGLYRIDAALSMRARPMGPALDALRQLGVPVVEDGEPRRLPIVVDASGSVAGGTVRLSGDVSSQFLSGLLMAAPYFESGIRVELTTPLVSRPYVVMTTSVMAAFGVTTDGLHVAPGRYQAITYEIEPDASAASYFFAAAAICGGRVTVDGLGTQSVQGDLAFVDLLERMGAVVKRGPRSTTVVGTGTLEGIDANLEELSDTAQTLAAVAVFADRPTVVRGIGFIRGKETDRIGAVVRELRRLGIEATEHDDGFEVHPGRPQPGRVETYDDHRMAMSFALLGLRAPGITIADHGCVAKTFPGFWQALAGLRVGSAHR